MCSYLVGVRVRVRVGVRVRVRVRVRVWVRAMCSYSGSLVLTSPPKTHTFRPPAKLVWGYRGRSRGRGKAWVGARGQG